MGGQQRQSPDGTHPAPPRIDTTVAHPARRYDYLLGGKDNFAADRASGDRMVAAFPTARTAILENRRFLHRTVTYLARQAGVRQFLDIGSGIPTSPNTHEIAQGIAPESRVVYADNDPIVLAHARALLTSTPEGATAYLDADLRQPERILADPDLGAILDLSQPVALMLIAVLHFVPDADDPHRLIATLASALPSGSYLAMSHGTFDYVPAESVERFSLLAAKDATYPRSRQRFAALFGDLEPVEPGIVSVADWRPEDEPGPRPTAAEVSCYGAVARIP